MALAGGAQAFDYCLAAALARGGIVFDLVIGDGVVGELCLGAQGGRGMLHDAAHELRHFLVGRISVGAHRAGEVGRAGDNVARGAAVQLADGNDGGFVGANLARNDGLQGIDDLGGHHDGVVAALGHGAVARGAADIDAEPVGIGHARAGLAAYGAGVDLAPDVRGVGAVDAVEDTRADHELGALAVFLAGLEDDADFAVDVVGHMAQDLQRAEHHGDMAVVAAGVHAALVDAGELFAGLLGDGQGVDVGAQQDAAAWRAVLAIGVGRGAAKGCHKARLKGTLVGDIHGVELVGDVRSRALLGKAQLRVLMEVAALLDDIGFKLGSDIFDGCGDVVSRTSLGRRHNLLCLGLRHGRFAPCWVDRKIVQALSSMPPAARAGKVAVCRLGFCCKGGGVHSGVLNFLPEMGMPMQHIDRIIRSKNVFTAQDGIDTARELAIAIAGVLVHPSFIELMAKAAQGEHVEFALIPVTAVKYTYTVIPALVMTWCLSYIERWVDRITPAVTKNFLKPMLIVLIAAPLAILLIGPIGIWIGSAISALVYTIHGYLGWLSVAIMGALWPLLVMTGMHRVFTPTIIQTIAETGKEGMVMPSEIGANLSLGGSSLAVAWKTKNPELRQTALAAAASAIMAGISEPALYGVAIRLKRPLIASLISGFICGAVAGMAGLASHSMAAPGLFTSVQFFDPANPMSIVWVFAVMALAVVLSFILTLLLGFEDIPVEEAAAEARKHQSAQPTVAKEVSLN